MSNNNTAILIFTRTEAQESEQKDWGRRINKRGQRNIAKRFIQHTLATAKKTKLPVFTCFGTEQYGNSFGEKLTNAIEDVFSKGYNNVITIGNDTPNLSSDLILKANQLLNHKKFVLGPSQDGGIYLLGIRKEAYIRDELVKMQWQTKYLIFDWKDSVQKLDHSISWLPELLDIDDEKSLLEFLKGKQNIFLLNKIKNILGGFLNFFLKINQIKQCSYIIRFSQLRAPPTLF